MFDYEVMNEVEAEEARYDLLPDGIYEAVVEHSKDKTSANSGRPMMEMTLNVFDTKGDVHYVKDWLVFTPKMMWKIIKFVESAGLEKEYLDKKLCSDIVLNRSVIVKIKKEEGEEIPLDKLNGKEPGSKYPTKNKVESYVKKDKANLTKEIKTEEAFIDDDLPF